MTTNAVIEWKARTPNGQIPLAQLQKIKPEMYDLDLDGPARMMPEAADAMTALIEESRKDGRHFVVKYSYRTLDVQWIKWFDYQNGGNLAARPGTSNHGDALSVDFTALDESDLFWLRNNAQKYGFFADVPGEFWHWTYHGGYDGETMEDMNLEEYISGQERYRQRYKEREQAGNRNPDPGDPPSEQTRHFKAGWNSERFGANNPNR